MNMTEKTLERQVLESKVLPELQAIAQSVGVESTGRMRKSDLIGAILEKTGNGSSTNNHQPANGDSAPATPVAVAPPAPAQETTTAPAPTFQPRPSFQPSMDVNAPRT